MFSDEKVKISSTANRVLRYASKAVWDTHMASKPVTDLLKSLEVQPSPLKSEVSIKYLSWIPEAHFERTTRLPSGSSHDLRDRVEHPFVLWATITDPQTADIDKLAPYGAAIVKYAKDNEPDTIFYGDAKIRGMTPDGKSDDVAGGFIAALEVYASKTAWLAHLQDDTVKALSAEAHRLDSTFGLLQLNMVEGWLTRQ